MDDILKRPDPDQLLNLLKDEEHKKERKRGYLKIFLGYVAGVGKTYRMLTEARLLKQKGHDVITGIVETHQRAETEALLDGLNTVAKKKIDYKGIALEEMDLDEIIRRKPEYVLVDELAHTNVAGSRHVKRYHDVEELLDSGISVYTTVNVQHIESLNEIIYQITGIKVKETVPDGIFEMADKIELVDLPVDEHLQRLGEGKVYIPEKAKVAATKFFREGNLLALRELSLRYTAKRVDDAMLSYMKLHKIKGIWQANARLLVCISPSPTSEHLIHMTHRYADDLNADWYAVYVESPVSARLRDEQKNVLEKNMHIAEELGGKVVRLSSMKPADELISFARGKNINLIILGYTRKPYIERLLKGSIFNDILEKSSPMQVLVVDSTGPTKQHIQKKIIRKQKISFPWKSLFMPFFIIFFTTGFSYILKPLLTITDIPLIFILAVIYSGVVSGLYAGILSSLLAVLCFDFFFVEPYLTFSVRDVRFIVTFSVIFIVGIVTNIFAEFIRRQNEFSRKRERYISTLYQFSRNLLSFSDLKELLKYTVKEISTLFDLDSVILIPDKEQKLTLRAKNRGNIAFDDHEKNVASWVFSHGEQAGFGTETLPSVKWRFIPLKVKQGVIGVLAVSPHREDFYFSSEEEYLLESFAGIISPAIANSVEL